MDLAAPISAAQAQAWWTYSPYWWMGYYLGGCCAASSWVGAIDYPTLTGQGWGLRALYVGQQSCNTCLGCGCAPLTDPVGQAQQDASDAATLARKAGFPTGATIFLDLEQIGGYTLQTPLLRYLGEWLYWLPTTYGYQAAVYTSAEQARQITATGIHPPFWIACYTGGTWTCPSQCQCYDSPSVWQWQGSHAEGYGGVTLDIDSNVSDGTGAGGAEPST